MPSYRFGPFTYHPQTGKLSASGSQQLLRHQVNRLLLLLIRNRKRLLTREDILTEIWPGEYVEPNNFFQCVNHLRKALGEHASKPQYFQNFRSKGYQWICPVEEIRAFHLGRLTKVPKFKLGLTFALCGWILWVFHGGSWNSKKPTTRVAQRAQETLPMGPISTPGNFLAGTPNRSLETPPATQAEPFVDSPLIPQKTGKPMKVFARARTAYLMGEILHSETLLAMASNRARKLGDRASEAMADLVLARVGRYRNPKSAKTKALRAKQNSADFENEVMYFEACYHLVLIHLDLDEIRLASSQLREPRFLASIKSARQETAAKLAEGIIAIRNNNLTLAENILRDLRAFPHSQMSEVIEPQVHLFEAALLFAQTQYDMAAVRVHKARDLLMREGKHPLLELRALWLSSQIESMRGNIAEANRFLGRTTKIADRYQFHFFKQEVNRFLTDHSPRQEFEASSENPDRPDLPIMRPNSRLELSPIGSFNL